MQRNGNQCILTLDKAAIAFELIAHPCCFRTSLIVPPSRQTMSTRRRSIIVTREPWLDGRTRRTTIADPQPIR